MIFSKRITALEGEIATHLQTISTVTAERDDLKTQLGAFEGWMSPEAYAAVVQERDQLKVDFDAYKAETPKKIATAASEQAVEIAAGVAVPPLVKETADPAQLSGSSLLTEYRALKGEARFAFFQKHQAAIFAASAAE